MERLTFEGNFCDIAMCREIPCPYGGMCSQRKTWERLKEYEDTGLEPEEIADFMKRWGRAVEIAGLCKNGGIDHLLELKKAEKDGRLVVLPCKVGDTVYRVLTTRDCHPVISEVKIKTVGQAADLIGRMGKRKLLSHYLTREEAEAALAQKGGKDNA